MEAPATTRLVIVEDNEVFREALELLLGLEPDVEIVASVADGESALAGAGEWAPDVFVVDYRLPDMDGVETISRLQEVDPSMRLIVLTAGASPAEVEALLAAGASRCLRKDVNFADIVTAIRESPASPAG
ncbi:MAG: response regulator transcription factor [Gaiellales bacterium]